MSQLHLSDEILMAFADGELDEPVAAAVAKAMVDSPGIAKRVVDFQQSRRLTRSVFANGSASPVPPELYAAVSAQIRAFEATNRQAAEPRLREARSPRFGRGSPYLNVALAASVAAIAVATGYFAGRQSAWDNDSLIAQLDHPLIRSELSRVASGRDVELPAGRMRVISTYRLPDGSLCREFRLQATSGAANAIACHQGRWNVALAVTSPPNDAGYIPSDGTDLTATYLQNAGAGEPLVEDAEAKALAEAAH
jgi:hypothetical protein